MTENNSVPVTTAGVFDILGGAIERAEEGSVRSNFGKLNIFVSRFMQWIDSVPHDVSQAEFAKLPERDKSMELTFEIDVKEFQPDLEWEYSRKVTVQPGSDWGKITYPSLKKILSKDVSIAAAFEALNNSYVHVDDVPQVKNPEFNTIKFIKIFDNRDECFTAWQEKYGDSDSQAPTASTPETVDGVPDGLTLEQWEGYVPFIEKDLADGKVPPAIAASYQIDVSFVMALVK